MDSRLPFDGVKNKTNNHTLHPLNPPPSTFTHTHAPSTLLGTRLVPLLPAELPAKMQDASHCTIPLDYTAGTAPLISMFNTHTQLKAGEHNYKDLMIEGALMFRTPARKQNGGGVQYATVSRHLGIN